MEIFKNKFFLVFLFAGALLLLSIVMRPSHKVNQDQIAEWITQGYAKQFCAVIYPNIAKCVTLQVSQCLATASSVAAGCVTDRKSDLPKSANQTEAKKIYDDVGPCFINGMHDLLHQKYLVETPECQEKLK